MVFGQLIHVSEIPIQQRDIHSETIGQRVHVHESSALGQSHGTMLLLHGLGDHAGRHEWVARLAVSIGFDVVAVDWPGNGGSPGIRGDIPGVEVAGDLIEEVLAESNSQPVGIFAHSTGAYLLVHWLARRPATLERLRWIWFSSPLVVPSHEQSPVKIALARKLSRLAPKVSLSTGVGVSDCYTKESQQRFERFRSMAEGVHNRISLRFAASLLDSESDFWPATEKLPAEVSYLVTEGSDDTVCPFPYAWEFFSKLPGVEKTFVAASRCRHEPFRESTSAGFVNAGRAWLSQFSVPH